MATTRLGLGGISRSPYGSFAGKAEAPDVVTAFTRLGLCGVTRSLYGNFTGKTENTDTGANRRWRKMMKSPGRLMN